MKARFDKTRAAWSTGAGRRVLYGVLAAASVSVTVLVSGAFAAPNPSPPTINSGPSAVSSSTSATFAFSGAPANGSYQCKLDAAASFTTCTSPKTYTGLTQGAHAFQVIALDNKGKQSSPTPYSWTIDTTAPTVSSIVRGDSSPRNVGPLHWTVTFSEPVNGVAAGNFTVVRSNTGGTTPSISSVTPAGSAPTATWTVTVSATGTTGTNAGSIGLNLTSAGAIKDVATNSLTGVPVTGQVYTYDTTAPTVASITRGNASPTNAPSVSWTVTFSEGVTGVATGNFALVASGFTGTPAVTAVTGSGSTYTLTASTTTTTTNTASLQLRLASVGAVKDLATNALAGVPFNGETYTVDRLAPPVAFGMTPPDPNTVSTSNFTWNSTPAASDFDRYECSTENGPFSTTVHSADPPDRPCATPLGYVVEVTNNGQHQFALRAYDHLGNFTQISWSWKVEAGSIQDFTIDGSLGAGALLYPGGATRSIPVTLNNPNNVPITVTAFMVSVDATSLPAGCLTGWFPIVQSDIGSTSGVVVPANGSVTLPAQGASAPTIAMSDSGNQDVCKSTTFTLKYTNGSAHS